MDPFSAIMELSCGLCKLCTLCIYPNGQGPTIDSDEAEKEDSENQSESISVKNNDKKDT